MEKTPTQTASQPAASIHSQTQADLAQTLEHVPCPACGETKFDFMFTGREMLRELDEPFDIVRCVKCNIKYTNPRPRLEFLGKYYPDDYYREVQDGAGVKHRPSREKGKREQHAQAAMRNHMGYPGKTSFLGWLATLPKAWSLRYGRKYFNAIPWKGEGRLLDFGFGDGKFIRLQRDRGWKVAGMDFNERIVEWLKTEDGIEAEVGSWPGPGMQGRQFDTITAWHVLEHIPNPPAWFESAAERLAPGGQLIICCPDSDSWAYEWFGRYWFGLDLPRHFLHYTKYDLKRLIEDAGLKVTRIRPQVRPTTLRRSAEYKARYTKSGWWRWLSKRTFFWRFIAMLSGWFGKADCVILYAQKPR